MRKFLVPIVMALTFASASFATAFTGDQCKFLTKSGAPYGDCNDPDLSYALWGGDIPKIKSMLAANPLLIQSCHMSLHRWGEWVTPLILSTCHGPESSMAEVTRILLSAGAARQINCETETFQQTAMKCARDIFDPEVRREVMQLLREAGATE